jgi:simple sugar transport system permease protein
MDDFVPAEYRYAEHLHTPYADWMFSVAALLVGGATVAKANIRNVFLGVILFHLMFIVSPMAGKNLIGQAQLGEYFRVFVSYGVITISLVLYEVRKKRDQGLAGLVLAAEQEETV